MDRALLGWRPPWEVPGLLGFVVGGQPLRPPLLQIPEARRGDEPPKAVGPPSAPVPAEVDMEIGKPRPPNNKLKASKQIEDTARRRQLLASWCSMIWKFAWIAGADLSDSSCTDERRKERVRLALYLIPKTHGYTIRVFGTVGGFLPRGF